MLTRKKAVVIVVLAVGLATLAFGALLISIQRQRAKGRRKTRERRLETRELNMQIASVRQGSGNVVVFSPYTGSDTDNKIERLLALDRLRSVVFDRVDLTDAGLRCVASLQQIKCLAIMGCNVGDNGLFAFEGNSTIDTLMLTGTAVSDESFEVLSSFKKLRVLVLYDDRRHLPHLTVDGAGKLAELGSLQRFVIGGKWVTEDAEGGIRNLKEQLNGVNIEVVDSSPPFDAFIR